MTSFKYQFPHKVENISSVYEYHPYRVSYDDYRYMSSADCYRKEGYRIDRMEIIMNYNDYQRLEEYIDDKMKIDDFLRENESARKLYDQIMVLYHLYK